MSRDPYDALIDQLLREILGGDRPRDISARVLAQAKIHDRFRRRWWVGSSSAIAACLALAAGLAYYWPHDYPTTHVTDGMVYNVNGSNELRAGATIVTDENNSGTINIGNYVNVDMAPDTSLTLGGKKYEENVILNGGHVDVQVTKNKGKFDVLVGQAIVHVTGTKFGLDVQEGVDEEKRFKTLFVSVEEGSVDVQGVKSPKTLLKGAREAFVISSEPLRVLPQIKPGTVTPPATTVAPTSPTPSRGRQGIGAGMTEGARIGNRGQLNRPNTDNNAARGGLLAGQNRVAATAAAAMVRNMLVVDGSGPMEQTGQLGVVGNWVYLQAADGKSYLLFPRSMPTVKDFKSTDGKVRVRWQGSTVESIEPATAPTKI